MLLPRAPRDDVCFMPCARRPRRKCRAPRAARITGARSARSFCRAFLQRAQRYIEKPRCRARYVFERLLVFIIYAREILLFAAWKVVRQLQFLIYAIENAPMPKVFMPPGAKARLIFPSQAFQAPSWSPGLLPSAFYHSSFSIMSVLPSFTQPPSQPSSPSSATILSSSSSSFPSSSSCHVCEECEVGSGEERLKVMMMR